MTSVQGEQSAKDAERSINIRALCDDLPCNKIGLLGGRSSAGMLGQKGKELHLLKKGDEDPVVLGRVQHYLATTPPEVRCRCNNGWCWRRPVNTFCCDARAALTELEEKLRTEKRKEMAALREQRHIMECAMQEKASAQAFERTWKDSFAPYLAGQFLLRVKAVGDGQLQFRYKPIFSTTSPLDPIYSHTCWFLFPSVLCVSM